MTAALYCVGEELENLMRTDRQTDREHTENSKPEATLIPVDCRGERAIKMLNQKQQLINIEHTTLNYVDDSTNLISTN